MKIRYIKALTNNNEITEGIVITLNDYGKNGIDYKILNNHLEKRWIEVKNPEDDILEDKMIELPNWIYPIIKWDCKVFNTEIRK